MPTKKKIIIKKKKQIIKVKQSQKVKVVVNVGNKSKTRVKRKAAAPQQKQPIIINTHVINQPAAQQYDQQQQLQQANQQKQQNYEELLNVPPVERNKLFPEKLKQKEYFENELTSKLRQPKKIAIRQPIIPVVQENELESTSRIKPIIIPRISHAQQYRNLINSGRKREDKRENAQVEANLLGQLQAEPEEVRGIRKHIIDERKKMNDIQTKAETKAANQIQKAAKESTKYKQEEVKGVMQNILNSIVDEKIKSNTDNNQAKKIQKAYTAFNYGVKERIKQAQLEELEESINPQTDVAEAKNAFLNVIKQPEENPREVDEAKPEPKKISKRQQNILIKKEAREARDAKAKAEAEAKAEVEAKPEQVPSFQLINKKKYTLKELQKLAADRDIQRTVRRADGKQHTLNKNELAEAINGLMVNRQRDINSKMGAI